MASNNDDRGRYLRTGWRIVGDAADAVVNRAGSYGDGRIEPGAPSQTLYAVRITLPLAVDGRPSVELLLDSMTDEIRRTWPDCPRLQRDQELRRPPSRFGGMHFDVLSDPGKEWLGQLVWRSVHPDVPGSPITTLVLIEERRSYVRISVRVTADDDLKSVRGFLGAGQSQPLFLRQLREVGARPIWLGGPVQPRWVGKGEIEDLVLNVLSSPERGTTVVVQSPLADGEYVVPPEDLAWELLGRAQLYVLRQHKLSFDLSDTVGGPSNSCYLGAARAYMPGWTPYDDPFEHPLLKEDPLRDRFTRTAWLGQLGTWLGERVTFPLPIDDRRSADAGQTQPSDAREADANHDSTSRSNKRRPKITAPTSVDPGESGQSADAPHAGPARAPELDPLLAGIVAKLEALSEATSHIADEIVKLRTSTAVRSSSTNANERRLARLEDILEALLPRDPIGDAAGVAEPEAELDPVAREDDPVTLMRIVDEVAESHADALIFLDSARSSASASPYEDPERVRAVLEGMGLVARKRRDGLLHTSLRDAFAELGIDYRGAIAKATSARMREQYRFPYNGSVIEAEEHIVLGNTYDPRRCLRIYFSSRMPDDPRFIVGHVGRHFEVRSSN